ncbi:FISUMP domain-containing protein [Flavobacterium sp. FlaQc-51]|uniref:FISUMP domain-containing protein n=1 Tax=unclassified Flavobacterium TaxID=196869 RepID=UPI000A58A4E2|nr:FISUMP domain-containing protein [Flavobacterium sp. Leaf82]
MKKKLFCKWLALLAILLSLNMQAQMTVGGKKAPEPFSVLELLNKGGLRLPQMTTAERNAFAVKGNDKGEGLTIYNKTTGCVEYWNKARWVSLCDGTSQTTISPAPCTNVAADGTGCDQSFSITDPDCPNGPFTIAIVAGADYASLTDVDERNGKFKIDFRENTTVDTHTVLVRVTSTCTSMYKEFLFSQNAVDCKSLTYAAPTISPSATSLSLCSGGAVYLSVPANSANLDKLIWTRNGIEIARGVNYVVAGQKGEYNISMGAVGCNINTANKRTITESGSAAGSGTTIVASNNGILCGTNSVTLTAAGTGTIAWFQNGIEVKSGVSSYTITGDSNVGNWFAVVKNGSCYSMPSNIIAVTKGTATGQVSLPGTDVLVNGTALSSFTGFCKGGSLDLSVANKVAGVTYTWYNGNDVITSNPFVIPNEATSINLRVIAVDNTNTKCSTEVSSGTKTVTSDNAPAEPNITGNPVLCDGTTDLTIVPAVAGTYTYTWYKDGVKITEKTATITVTTPGVTYSGSVTNATGCTSTLVSKKIAVNVSSLPVLSWVTKPASATYGATITLQTAIEFGPASSYTWTADNGATVTGSGASVSVKLPASGTEGTPLKVTVLAENSCGKSVTIDQSIAMNAACPTPTLTAQSDLSQSITQGSSATVAVSVTGGVSPTYQWYLTTTANTSGGSIISGATTASYTYSPASSGTFYLYCIVTNGCAGNLKATSSLFTVTAAINPDSLETGSGTLRGKTCFDIAESNDNANCGTLTSRTSNKADFNLAATNTQTYTFTPSSAVSNIRFAYVESLGGAIIKSITNNGDPTAKNVSGAVTATVVYKNNLSSNGGVQGAAYGKTTENALSVNIYVIYNNKADGTGTDVKVQLRAEIKDCACCGAFVGPGGIPQVWKNFMCHNLGADQNLDPFVSNSGLYGNYYSWGNWTTTNNPCPAGYRIPNSGEWVYITQYNSNNINPSKMMDGLRLGSTLYLPLGGYYDNNVYVSASRSGYGIYWTSDHLLAYINAAGVSIVGDISPGSMSRIRANIRCMSDN